MKSTKSKLGASPLKQYPEFPKGRVRLERTRPRFAVTIAPFAFLSRTLGIVDVEIGFDTDYASIPRIFWAIYPPDGEYTDIAVVHDVLYWYQANGKNPITRAQADKVFLEGMEVLEIPFQRRWILYLSVRAGGWVTWLKRARQIAKENK